MGWTKFPLPPPPMTIDAPLPSQRQGSKRAHNLSVSSCPRVPNYTIGRDSGKKSEPRVLGVSTAIQPTQVTQNPKI